MRQQATPRFWRCYRQLPGQVQRSADRCYELLRHNPSHPSLHLKRVGRFWSVRVGLHYRALAVEHDGDLVWFWIGSHADYDHLLGRGEVGGLIPGLTTHSSRLKADYQPNAAQPLAIFRMGCIIKATLVAIKRVV